MSAGPAAEEPPSTAPTPAPDPAAGPAPGPGRAADVSVVICAYTEERWDDVLAAVASVRSQRRAPREIIVVVDHNPALQERLTAALPDCTVLANQHPQGLSGGKNTGTAAAGGEIVAFLDDDAVAEPDWLEALARRYDDPAVVGVGGLTRPLWAVGRPGWFPAEFDWVVGCSYIGLPPDGGVVRNLAGGNASFRRWALEAVGGFRSGIGRDVASGASRRWQRWPFGCEETELCIRVAQRWPGVRFVYDRQAVIWHRVPAARSRFGYFTSRCIAEGMSKALVARSVGMGAGLSSERRYVTRVLPAGVARGIWSGVRGRAAGFGRAGAIVAGVAAAAAGYAVGVASPRPPAPPVPAPTPMVGKAGDTAEVDR